MNIYHKILITLLVQLVIVAVVPDKKIKLNKQKLITIRSICVLVFFTVDILILMLIMYARDKTVGTDLSTYLYYYDVLGNVSKEKFLDEVKFRDLEYGYSIFFRILYKINSNHEIYMLVSSFFIMIPLYYFIKKKSNNELFSLLLFICLGLYNQSFNTIRQFMAMGILLISFSAIKDRKLKLFLFEVSLATLFHTSAIIFIIIYPLYNVLISREKLFFIAIGSIGTVAILRNILATFFIRIMGYEKYYDRVGLISIIMIVEILITFIYIFFYNKFRRYDKKANIWVFMSIITVCLSLLGLKIDLFHRVTIYFQIGYIISIPSFISSFKCNLTRNVGKIVVILLFSIYYLQALSNSSLGETVPYILRY